MSRLQRSILVPALCAAVIALGCSAARAQQTIRVSTGRTVPLEYEETPSTGYTWAFDRQASRGLDVVSVEDGGHRPGRDVPGAPGTRLWILHALKPGLAHLVFILRRPWEPAAVETRRVLIDVGR
jgi:predicted secreted protein